MRNKDLPKDFTIEWYKLVPETASIWSPILIALEPIFIDAFLPLLKKHSYTYDPRLINIEPEKQRTVEPEVTADLTHLLQTTWREVVAEMYNTSTPATTMAVAYDAVHMPIGFALFQEIALNDYLKSRKTRIPLGPSKQADQTQAGLDEIFVYVMAVKPGLQRKGIGSTLLFNVLEYYPHIKTIYLVTSMSETNKNAQQFYEHVGFIEVNRFFNEEALTPFWRERIVYLYKKS